jgi:hypothetical protein
MSASEREPSVTTVSVSGTVHRWWPIPVWSAILFAVATLVPSIVDAVLVRRWSEDEFAGLIVLMPPIVAVAGAAVGFVVGMVLMRLPRLAYVAVAVCVLTASTVLSVWMPTVVAGDCHDSFWSAWPDDARAAFDAPARSRVSRLRWEHHLGINRPSAEREIFIGSVSRPEATRVTKDACSDDSPDLSPDGQRVAYRSWPARIYDAAGNEPMIYIRERGSARPNRVAGTRNATCPRWAPDSQRLLVWDKRIRVIDMSGRTLSTLEAVDMDVSACPSWSSDGRHIYAIADGISTYDFARTQDLVTYSAESGRLLARERLAIPVNSESNIALAPNGSALAFVVNTPVNGHDLYLSESTGRHQRLLQTLGSGYAHRSVSWSSDSKQLAVWVGDETSPTGLQPALVTAASGATDLIGAPMYASQPFAR